MISPQSIEQVLAAANVEEVVGDYVQLKRSGSNLKGLCPFHNEKTPSFMVSPGKNIYKCFGCGESGNGVRFVMEYEGLGFVEAIRSLAQRYNIQLEETRNENPEYIAEKQHKDSLYIVNEFAANYYQDQLVNTDEGKAVGLSYFKSRGYNKKIIEQFRLGYADKQRTSFKEEAEVKKYNKEFLTELGLVTKKNDFDFFRERVMFPILGLSGKVVAFAGRLLKKNDRAPKYLNSPESEIYNKRDLLYGIFQAKNPIRKKDECIIVEGYTDVITLHQFGVDNAVASSGTSLTEGQIRLIKRFTNNVKILYDGDPAGIKAALRGIDLVLAQDMDVKLVLLPEGEDPDSYLKSVGSTAFEEYLSKEAKDFILFKTSILLEEAGDDPIRRTRVLKSIVESISHIPDALKRNVYIQSCATRLAVSEEILVKEVRALIASRLKQEQIRNRHTSKTTQTRPGQLEKYPKPQKFGEKKKPLDDYNQERDLLRVLMQFGHKVIGTEDGEQSVQKFILAEISDFLDKFDHDKFAEVFNEIVNRVAKKENCDVGYYVAHPNKDKQDLVIDLITNPYEYAKWEEKDHFLKTQKPPDDNHQQDTLNATLRFQERKVARTILEIERRLKDAKDDDEILVLMQAHMHVKSVLSGIHEKLGTVVLMNALISK